MIRTTSSFIRKRNARSLSMNRKAHVLLAFVLLLSLVLQAPTVASRNAFAVAEVSADSAGILSTSTRIAGADRYLTAIEASKANFGSAGSVILATGTGYADALSASALAGVLDAPLLLTRPGALGDGTLGEIQRLGAKDVYIMGSTAAVSAGVESALKSAGLGVERIAGTDRYGTSAAVAQKVASLEGAAFAKKAFLARGDDFADGLAVSPIAYKNKIPVVLTQSTALAGAAAGAIEGLRIDDVTILGSDAAVSSGAEDAVKALGTRPTVRRISGATRYGTAQEIAAYAFENSLATKGFIGIATGADFPDALAGGVATGRRGGILVITAPDAPLRDWATCLSDACAIAKPDVQIYGGSNVVPDSVMDRLHELLPGVSAYAIGERGSVPDGTQILFTASQQEGQIDGYSIGSIWVLTSMDELDAFLDAGGRISHTYDQAFFKDNAIIVMLSPGFGTYTSGVVKMQIDSLTRNNNEICIETALLLPSVITTDVRCWYSVIDVKKADIEGVNEFSYFLKYGTY